ncbi:MAG: hypothetical protein VB051_09645 [Candidatus Pelethousia sp.]|nr:hypothetical protein [Candidatus Pelethousia sp.]
MRKHFVILLAFLLLVSLALPALAAPAAEATPAPMMNEDGAIVADESPNMFWSYMGGIALFAIVILSIWIKVRALQSGAGGRR